MSLSPNAFVPSDALRLNEDISALRRAMEILDTVDPRNVTKDAELGHRIIRVTQRQLRACQRYAQNKLRREYLAPPKRKFERR